MRGWWMLAAVVCLAGCQPKNTPEILAGWYYVQSVPEGWPGRSYTSNGQPFAEEFDTNGDGRFDLWRFYERGRLSSEQRDLLHDGRVTFESFWDTRNGRLLSVARDTRGTGVNDLEVIASSVRDLTTTWEVRQDRNGDGIADLILLLEGPPNLFESLNIDLSTEPDVASRVPVEFWRELRTDDDFIGEITDRIQFRGGVEVARAVPEGDTYVWRRLPRSDDAPRTRNRTRPEPTQDVGPEWRGGPVDDVVVTPAAPDRRQRWTGLPPGGSSARSLPKPMSPPGGGIKVDG